MLPRYVWAFFVGLALHISGCQDPGTTEDSLDRESIDSAIGVDAEGIGDVGPMPNPDMSMTADGAE